MTARYPGRLRGWRFVLFNIVLGIGHIIVLSNLGSYAALVPFAAGDLAGVLPSFAIWPATDFLIALVLGFPIARWLAARLGDYCLFMVGLVIFALASFFCAISETLWLFLPARIILGFASGATVPCGQTLLLNEYPERMRSLGQAIWDVVTFMPIMIAIPLGGWIGEHIGWRSLFYLNIPVALAIAGVIGSLLYGRGFRRRIIRFDGIGFILLAVILFGIQTFLNMGNDFEWLVSPLLTGVIVIVLVALPCFIIWETADRHPVLDIRLFGHRNFAIGMICSVLGFLSIQGSLAFFAVQLQLLLGYSSSLAGLVFMAMILLPIPVVMIAHEFIKDIDARFFASLSFLGFALTLFWIGTFDDASYFDQIFWPMLFLGFFVGTFFAPLAAITLHGLPPRVGLRAAEGAGLLRMAAGALGVALEGVILYRRTPFHQLDLADHFGGRRFASLELLDQLSVKLQMSGFTPGMVTGKLGTLITEKSALLGTNDAFLVSSFVFLGLAALVWLARPTRVAYVSREKGVRKLRAEELTEQP